MCVCVILFSFLFLLSLFVTLYIFLHLTVMHSSTFGKGWVGMSACPLVVLACESLHVCTVCIWRCEHARFCVEVFYALYINFHSFIHSKRERQRQRHRETDRDQERERERKPGWLEWEGWGAGVGG